MFQFFLRAVYGTGPNSFFCLWLTGHPSRLLRRLSPSNRRLSVPSLEIGDCLSEGSFLYHLPAVDARVCFSQAGTTCVDDCGSSEPLEFSLVFLLETEYKIGKGPDRILCV